MNLVSLFSLYFFVMLLPFIYGIDYNKTKPRVVNFFEIQLRRLIPSVKSMAVVLGPIAGAVSKMLAIQDALYPDTCWKRGLGKEAPFRLNLSTGVRKGWCDTVTDGGGWMLFQRHMNGIESFHRNWTEYQDGFGHSYGDFWLGNDNLHELTWGRKWKLRLEGVRYQRLYYSVYDLFRVNGEDDKYRLTLGRLQNGTQGLRSRMYHGFYDVNNMPFTTYDRDNDFDKDKNCGVKSGGFWYNHCTHVQVNGVFGMADRGEMIWYEVTGWHLYMHGFKMKMKEFFTP